MFYFKVRLTKVDGCQIPSNSVKFVSLLIEKKSPNYYNFSFSYTPHKSMEWNVAYMLPWERHEALTKTFKSAYFSETKNLDVDYIMPNF